jgi:hypothetical protein
MILVPAERYSTPTEVVWLFDATIWIWAYLMFCTNPYVVGGGGGAAQKPLILGWKPPAWLDQWILTGVGEISVQGLGSGKVLTLELALKAAADRLEVMSWGLAARYRKVIDDMLIENQTGLDLFNGLS